MQRIIVDKSSLDQKFAEIGGGAKLIELCIVPGQIDSEQFSPAFLHVGVIDQDGTYKDFEGVDESAVLCRLTKKSA